MGSHICLTPRVYFAHHPLSHLVIACCPLQESFLLYVICIPIDSDLEVAYLEGDGGEDGSLTPMQQIESARSQWRKKEELKLEESWTSLNLFDRSQKGRISLDLESICTFENCLYDYVFTSL